MGRVRFGGEGEDLLVGNEVEEGFGGAFDEVGGFAGAFAVDFAVFAVLFWVGIEFTIGGGVMGDA